ncbi:MAG TPA: hypothetical protein VN950_07360 [Terriglobales bacterium]|nr:hypothetical protein [Terriglobales bacterium]
MKRSSGPHKTASLSESFHERLNAYALAASAAGVGVFALTQAAEAKIIYTPADKSIAPNHTIPLDLNHDGTIDFRFKDAHFTSPTYGFDHTGILSIRPAHQGNKIEGFSRTARHYASALRAGVSIGPKVRFTPGPKVMATMFSDTGAGRFLSEACNGPWSKAKNRYLGLEFLIKGKVHYGWARLNVSCQGTDVFAILTGYAYETIPNKAIKAGQTKGADESTAEDFDPSASVTGSVLDKAQPATLGALAIGAPGLSVWRKKGAALESD